MSAAVTEKKLPWLEGTQQQKLPDEISAENPLRVVIAGGGVGGLLSAKYLKMQGYDVSLPYVFRKIDIIILSVRTLCLWYVHFQFSMILVVCQLVVAPSALPGVS